jgi:hypothetical protein
MFKLTLLTLAVGITCLLLAGCSEKAQPAAGPVSQPGPSSDNVKRVALHVEGMTKVQGIT